MLVIGTLALRGLISLAYKKVRPKKPVGKNRLKRKMKAPATPTAAILFGWLDVPATTAIHVPIPAAANIINLRLPKRSTVRTPIGEQSVWNVNTLAPRTLASTSDSPR